jgi:hypothetical protein
MTSPQVEGRYLLKNARFTADVWWMHHRPWPTQVVLVVFGEFHRLLAHGCDYVSGFTSIEVANIDGEWYGPLTEETTWYLRNE